MPNIIDRYHARPKEEPFRTMCAATFVSEYRVVCSSGQGNTDRQSRTPTYVLSGNLGVVQKRTRSKPAIIRFPKFNKDKDTERYYATLLKLYLPHYCDTELKPTPYTKYEEFYSDGFVSIFGNTDDVKVCDIVQTNRQKFEGNVDNIPQTCQDFNDTPDIDDPWAQILPDAKEHEQVTSKDQEDEDISNAEDQNIPDLATVQKSKQLSFTLERCQLNIPTTTAIPLMQSMNWRQQQVFYFVRDWCLKVVQGKRPDPFHIFLTGGAGTGKSHITKCIAYMASRILQPTQENPDKVAVLITAPTGTAAFNIGGTTLHHAFHLARVSVKYQPLSESTLNAVRAQYESLQIVITDEVSMVDKKLMSSVHGRLSQLRQANPNTRFGNMSILAVGDMFQIPPVKGQSLYKATKADFFPLWNGIFQLCELKDIMRQRNDALFAELLNRLRVKRKKEQLSDEDNMTLLSRVLSVDFTAPQYPQDALHIFATNALVSEHNDKMLHLRCPQITTFEASDFQKDPST
ncbi:uncharacterized protein LOC118409861 [Branchiostoma floridae]|uniref:ATP-dependent DNA helicase n=1 Tax=Branchiostoma floridae TaxID=7739 RepID=A0A9J7KNA5_BRAFL|nr:uncharacterized protein LOC118409861 [Branchiostoma floridae]